MTNTIVTKFGGSSVTCLEDLERVKEIIQDDKRRRVIVVSAPGSRFKGDKRVTDLLIELANTGNKEIIDKIIERYGFYPGNNDERKRFLMENLNLSLPSEAREAVIKSFGEHVAARELSKYLNAEYVDPKELFLVNQDFKNARILPESAEITKRRLNQNKVYVIPGFYGYTKDGLIATFSRQGSNLTASNIAASLDALIYENYTDEKGVFAADPEIVENPKRLDEITFNEMRDLSYIGGFNILHPQTLIPLERKRIPVHIRSTKDYPEKGTYITYDRISDPNQPIAGIGYKDGFCSFDIEKFGLNDELGILKRVLEVLEHHKVSLEFPVSAIDDLSLIVRQSDLKDSIKINKIMNELYLTLGEGSQVNFKDNLASIAIAGQGLKDAFGIENQILSVLINEGIYTKFISIGEQRRCFIYGVLAKDGPRAVRLLYEKFVK